MDIWKSWVCGFFLLLGAHLEVAWTSTWSSFLVVVYFLEVIERASHLSWIWNFDRITPHLTISSSMAAHLSLAMVIWVHCEVELVSRRLMQICHWQVHTSDWWKADFRASLLDNNALGGCWARCHNIWFDSINEFCTLIFLMGILELSLRGDPQVGHTVWTLNMRLETVTDAIDPWVWTSCNAQV